MMYANGVISQPYVQGVVYTSGNPVYGFPCVSPILDLTNLTDAKVVINYASRAEALFLPGVNKVFLAPGGGRTLLTNMLPGSIGAPPGVVVVSYIAIGFDGSSEQFDVYALVFMSGAGYQLVPAAGHFGFGAGGEIVKTAAAPTSCVTPTVGVFPLEFCKCAKPSWPWTLVYTAAIGLNGQCNNRGAIPPCETLATWVLSSPAPSQ